MTITEAKKFHEQQYEFSLGKEVILASGSKNPTYRTVQNWYDAWRNLNLGPRSGEGLIEVSFSLILEILLCITKFDIKITCLVK